MTILALDAADWPQVERIYREGIATGDATFESEPPTWQAFDAGKVRDPRLVAVDGDEVVGWAAAAEAAGYWMVQSSIFPENAASLALHEKHGFRTVGRREAIALMSYGPHEGRWRDTVLVEWRSRTVGR